MKRNYILLTMTLILLSCGNKKAPAERGADSLTIAKDSLVVETSQEKDPAFEKFFEQLSFDNFVDLLKNPYKETAEKCGLSFLFHEDMEVAEEGDADGSCSFYGWGIEKIEKQENGYHIICTSDHACYFYYQEDTSKQAAMCFKNKDDANRFIEKALAYGLVDMNGSYHIAEEKLPNGTVKVDSFRDYQIITEMMKPEKDDEFHQGFYVIRFYYFS